MNIDGWRRLSTSSPGSSRRPGRFGRRRVEAYLARGGRGASKAVGRHPAGDLGSEPYRDPGRARDGVGECRSAGSAGERIGRGARRRSREGPSCTASAPRGTRRAVTNQTAPRGTFVLNVSQRGGGVRGMSPLAPAPPEGGDVGRGPRHRRPGRRVNWRRRRFQPGDSSD